ncbi:tetratricopeptide repeat protein [Kamptonema formosum]|uniref:tetratricopeptide repeat protein n=1 Tax=Kamptonema formosum TaxID=331992 RepID=UPI0003608E93|nr:tetratricopeptide repeat protein [Oscillatoria sp. PCC 10802]
MCGTQAQEDTLAALNRAIEQNPQDIRAIARRGEMCRLAGRYEDALADFSRAIALQPDYAWAIAHRGETYYLLKRYREALADFNRAVELQPTYVWALAHRGASYHRLNRYDEALADFNKVLELKRDYAWAFFYRGQLHCLVNRYEEALADCDRAIALDKTIIPSWPGERGLLLSYLGRYAEVIECCERGLQDSPDDFITLYTLAVVKARWKGLGEAQAEIQQTRTALQAGVNGPQRAGALYRLGGLAALEGHSEEALNYLSEAISLENEPLELARRDLAWLDLRADRRFQSLIATAREE